MITEKLLDAIFNSFFFDWAWIFMPLSVFVLSLYLLRRQPLAIKIISSLIFSVSILFFCQSSALTWVFRDGLGPDAVESHGDVAVSRFMQDFTPLAIVTAILFLSRILLCVVASIIRKLRVKSEITRI